MKINLKTGIGIAIITAIISGFSVFYNKLVVVGGIDSTIFNIIKNGGVGIILTLFLLSRGTFGKFTKLTKKEWGKLFLIAGIGGSIPFILFFEGLKSVPAATGNVLNKSLFIWVALLAVPFLGEKLKPIRIIGYILLALGIFFAVPSFRLTASRGEFMILTATLLWAIEVIIAKKTLKTIDSSLVAWARMAIGTMFLIVIAGIQGKLTQLTHVSQGQLLAIFPSILFLTGYVTSWLYALKRSEAIVVTSTLALAPIITTLLSLVFIPKGTKFDLITLVLPILGVAAILLSTRKNKSSELVEQ